MRKLIDGWTIDTYETTDAGLIQRMESPKGILAAAFNIGIDGRLSRDGEKADVGFVAKGLKLSPQLVGRMVKAANEYVEAELAVNPKFTCTQV